MSRFVPAMMVSKAQADAFVDRLHRHHEPDQGAKWVLGCWDTTRGELVGVAVVGQPRGKWRRDVLREVVEITRMCTDGTRNACSWLYARCADVAWAKGYRAIVTYTLGSEGGASLRAAGWWGEKIEISASATWANRDGRKDPVRADMRWVYLLATECVVPPEVLGAVPQFALELGAQP